MIARWQWRGGSGGARQQRVSVAEVAVVVVAQRSGAFERHQRADISAFILGQGWRDNGPVDVFILGRGWRDNGTIDVIVIGSD